MACEHGGVCGLTRPLKRGEGALDAPSPLHTLSKRRASADRCRNKTKKTVAEAALRRSSGHRKAGGTSEETEGGGGSGVRYMTSPVKRELFSNHMYIEHRLNLGVVDRKVRWVYVYIRTVHTYIHTYCIYT